MLFHFLVDFCLFVDQYVGISAGSKISQGVSVFISTEGLSADV